MAQDQNKERIKAVTEAAVEALEAEVEAWRPKGGRATSRDSEEGREAALLEAIALFMKCIPILDLQVSEHNDARRLRQAICDWLAARGYPGWLEGREL